ncbi:MAG TPA: hypothetical protein VF221_04820 [Chloroflexota bacterium]
MPPSRTAGKRHISVTGAAAAFLVLAAVGLIILPNLFRAAGSKAGSSKPVHSEISTIDPAALMPKLTDLPQGASIQSNTYVTTAQAAKRNNTSLALLKQTGREIGYDRDFLVPQNGDIDVEVVRFKSHAGMGRAYRYFLGLPNGQGLRETVFRGLGERAALVIGAQAGFVEFMRGRYYAVVTTVPLTRTTLNTIGAIARQLDSRISHYQSGA